MEICECHSFAKINIGLKILGKRRDGFHEIRTVFQTINLYDQVKIERSSKEFEILCQERKIPRGRKNLMSRVIFLLQKKGYDIPPLRIHLEKRIPAGSGLGGGSSNAATILIGLNELFHLGISWRKMMKIAAQVGSDVPYFLWGGTALGAGRGEEIYPLRSMGKYWVCLAIPKAPSSSQKAYARISRILTGREKDTNIRSFIYSIFKGKPDFSLVDNDFEKLLFKKDSLLLKTKGIFKKYHPCCKMLSGSGSSIYALFVERQEAEKAALAIRHSNVKDEIEAIVVRTLNEKEYQRRLLRIQS